MPFAGSVMMPDGRLTLTKAADIRRLVEEALAKTESTFSPARLDMALELLVGVAASVVASLDLDEIHSVDFDRAFRKCGQLGAAVAQVEEDRLQPKPGRTSPLARSVLAFVAIRHTKHVPRDLQVIGNYIATAAHYAARTPRATAEELLLASSGSASAFANNARYLVLAKACDEIWKQNIEVLV